MASVRTFYPRRPPNVGKVIVQVAVANLLDPMRKLEFGALVDTGAFGLVLPLAWKDQLGELPEVEMVEIDTAAQRVGVAGVGAPVRIQLEGFRQLTGDAIRVEVASAEH